MPVLGCPDQTITLHYIILLGRISGHRRQNELDGHQITRPALMTTSEAHTKITSSIVIWINDVRHWGIWVIMPLANIVSLPPNITTTQTLPVSLALLITSYNIQNYVTARSQIKQPAGSWLKGKKFTGRLHPSFWHHCTVNTQRKCYFFNYNFFCIFCQEIKASSEWKTKNIFSFYLTSFPRTSPSTAV